MPRRRNAIRQMVYSVREPKVFGADDPPLPADFAACVRAGGVSSPACDGIVGGKPYGYGYCNEAPYEHSIYCACVNSGVARPECLFGPCTSGDAYKTSLMRANPLPCPDAVTCTTVDQVGGYDNLAARSVPGANCDSTARRAAQWLLRNLSAIVLLFILVVVIALLAKAASAGDVSRREVTTRGG